MTIDTGAAVAADGSGTNRRWRRSVARWAWHGIDRLTASLFVCVLVAVTISATAGWWVMTHHFDVIGGPVPSPTEPVGP